jgi:hypothetical protein
MFTVTVSLNSELWTVSRSADDFQTLKASVSFALASQDSHSSGKRAHVLSVTVRFSQLQVLSRSKQAFDIR